MRDPGDSNAGRLLRRLRSPSQQPGPPPEQPLRGGPRAGAPGPDSGPLAAAPDSWQRPAPGSGLPRGRHRPDGRSAGKGPLRGFPPPPGQPAPLYPPGQFAAWNQMPARDGGGPGPAPAPGAPWAGRAGYPPPAPGQPRAGRRAGGPPRRGGSGYLDADYSALAVSEPAADVTSTQTWEAVDDGAGSWAPAPPASGPMPAVPAERGRHGARSRPPGAGGAGGRGAGTGTSRTLGTGTRGTGPQAAVARSMTPPAAGPAPAAMSPASRAAQGTGGRPAGRKRRGRGRTVLACAIVALVVIGGGGVYLKMTTGHHAAARKAAEPKPTVDPRPPASLGPWGFISSRATDPVPLSTAELFPARFTAAGVTYAMTVTKPGGTPCSVSLVGPRLATAAQKAGCSQAMRASYLSSGTASAQVMATIGVLNLTTATTSQATGTAAGPQQTIRQLPGPSGPTKNLTKGTGLEAAEVKGHYLVLVWAEFASLRAPATAAQKQQLESFISLLIERTANVSLAIRQVTGKPAS